jgi:exopolyphosphatase/guanosine-5'-triphosphate,3'-diphosphate pyrophosphatase
MRVAAIDIGSNSIRLLVADVGEGGGPLTTVARAGESCRLAHELARTGMIGEAIAKRAADLTLDFARRGRALGAKRILAAATAALRDARNGAEVAERIATRAGLRVRILSGAEEARTVYAAVVQGLGGSARRSPCVVFDIGGGSTEVVSGMGESPGRWTSFGFGAVSLTERFLGTNPPTAAEIEDLCAHVRLEIMQQCASMPQVTPVLAGVGGTVTVLAMLDRKLSSYEPSMIEGWRIRRDRLEDSVSLLVSTTTDERRRWPAMGEGRADIVIAGALVVRMLSERFPSDALICSTQGLRYGLARLAATELESESDRGEAAQSG